MPHEPRACDYCGTVWAANYDEYVLLIEHYEPDGPHDPDEEGCSEAILCNRRCLLHWLVDDIFDEADA